MFANAAQFGLPDPNGEAGAVFSNAFLKPCYAREMAEKCVTYSGVLKSMRCVLEEGNDAQVPQLSTSRRSTVANNKRNLTKTSTFLMCRSSNTLMMVLQYRMALACVFWRSLQQWLPLLSQSAW